MWQGTSLIVIDKRIVNQFVVNKDEPVKEESVIKLIDRPEQLTGTTYKLKTPMSDHSLYITINDRVVDGQRFPFEIFLNSKSVDHFQWTTALTRVMSAVFRQGGNINFLIEELRSVFDPKGGYFKKGKYSPSLVSEIGDILEQHLIAIGLYQKDTSLAESAQAMMKEKWEKQEKYEQSWIVPESTDDGYPKDAVLCEKCNTRAMMVLDGCLTCLSCGGSKCG